MANVFRTNEVSLFGNFYPTAGPVRSFQASGFAEKRVTGDTTKDDELLESSWIISDLTEGIGILDMNEKDDAKRYWWGDLDTDRKGHMTLSTLVTDAGNPTGVDCQDLREYGNEMYAVFGQSARKWVEATASWGSELASLTTFPTDSLVHKSKLYYACGTDFDRFDGTTWTTGTALSGAAVPARYFVEWDSKLMAIDNDGQLRYSVDEGVTWALNALSTLPSGYFTGLLLFVDDAGDPLVHLRTKEGFFALDFDNAEWVRTSLPGPYHDYAGMGACVWRESAFVSAGLAVYRYGGFSQSADDRLVGPDRDYGMPNEYTGSIIKLLPGINAIYAIIDATTAEYEEDLFTAGGAFGMAVLPEDIGSSTVLKWSGKGWRPIYIAGEDATAATAGVIATADDVYRLWCAMNNTVYLLPLQTTIQNPLETTDFPFQATADGLITGEFDADNSVIDKTATRFAVYVTDCTATEYFQFYYRKDYATAWTLLDNASLTDGKTTTDGEHEFTFASDAGLEFKVIQFKAVPARGSTSTLSPDCRWMRLKYLKRLDVRKGFYVPIDCTRNYRHKTARALEDALWTALEANTLGEFTFRNGNGTETHRVMLIPPFEGAEVGGKRREGVFKAILVAP